MNEVIDSTEFVARAIFSPLMIDQAGKLLRAAFSLRHNEDYVSVCQMSKRTWMDDVMAIPTNQNRVLEGYAAMSVGEIRNLSFVHQSSQVSFDVIDKSSAKNLSHGGIVICYGGSVLKGDRNLLLKELPEDVSAPVVLLRAQRRLLSLANRRFVRLRK